MGQWPRQKPGMGLQALVLRVAACLAACRLAGLAASAAAAAAASALCLAFRFYSSVTTKNSRGCEELDFEVIR